MSCRNLRVMNRYKARFSIVYAAIAVLTLLPAHLLAGGLTLDQGSSISLGSGHLQLGCNDMSVHGALNLDTGVIDNIGNVVISTDGVLNGNRGKIEFGKDWSNEGSFTATESSVSLVDECSSGASTIGNDNTFYNLSVVTSAGKNVFLDADKSQNVINDLVLTGTDGNLLVLRSTLSGVYAIFVLSELGGQLIDYVDVQDNWAMMPGQHLARGWPHEFNSLDSGNNMRWFFNFGFLEPVPSLSYPGSLLLIVFMLMGAVLVYGRKFS